MLNKPLSGKNPYGVKLSIATEQVAATRTPLENPSTQSSSVPNKSHIFSKSHDDFRIEQIKKLNTEVTALKSLIMEQLYVIKKSVKNFLSGNVTPNNLELWIRKYAILERKYNKNLNYKIFNWEPSYRAC